MNRDDYISSVYEIYFNIELDYINKIHHYDSLFRAGAVTPNFALDYYILHKNYDSFQKSFFGFVERLKFLDL